MPSSRRPRASGVVLLVLLALLTGLAAALLPATTVHAAGRTVQGGRLDWGVKSSFQSYVTGPIAQGSYSLGGGAATVGGGRFRFHSATGSYDSDSGGFTAGFSGSVHFLGHRQNDGSYQLDMTISRPTVRISGGGGTLYVDIASRAKGSGKVSTSSQVAFASLALGGITMRGGGNVVQLTGIPATLTAQGARSFAGYYTAGTALDPVSLSADVKAPAAGAAKPKPSGSGKGGGSAAGAKVSSAKPTKKPAKPAKNPPGTIEDGAVDWGVRRTFREYVTGEIAHGGWKLSGGAEDGGAFFRFSRGEGTYDKKKQILDADFAGTIRFTGAQGLDLALGGVGVNVEDGEGTLSADVTGGGTTTRDVPLVTFAATRLKAGKGLVTLTEAPARLTAEGARAFNSMYRPGTEMDPVSLSVALDPAAALPALPDLGSGAGATPRARVKGSGSGSARPGKSAAPRTEAAADASHVPVLPLGIAAGVLLAAGAGFGVVRKRQRRLTDEAS
ncbi:HtaA domain-containing protein [Streptomyces sp. NPDC006638]|uniref:HtaA domain-containing protein n=1 Tax=Streptomyces sp. NPDC006638 TaxID=3157183 RepID=UPI0033AFAC1F